MKAPSTRLPNRVNLGPDRFADYCFVKTTRPGTYHVLVERTNAPNLSDGIIGQVYEVSGSCKRSGSAKWTYCSADNRGNAWPRRGQAAIELITEEARD